MLNLLHQFKLGSLVIEEEARFKPEVSFEATPVVWDGIVRICARDGWIYTLG